MTEAQKESIKKVMVDHLTTLGYPNIAPEVIMGELKPMWIKLEEAGLIVDGMNYAEYADHAQGQYMFAQIKETFGI